jgi:segregation and condensation protein B
MMSTRSPEGDDEALESAGEEGVETDAVDALEPAEIDAQLEPDVSLDDLRRRARKLAPEEVQRTIDALLFVSDKPLTLEAVEKSSGILPEAATVALTALSARYASVHGGIVLHEVAGGFQLRSAPEAAEAVRRMLQIKPQRLTRAALETLAIIAYRQPVTRPEIEDIRAVDCGAILKALLERKLIKILGKKEEPGHPLLYGTAREFLEFFNLKNLASLPTLREFQELSEESREIVEKETGPAPAPIAGTVAELSDPAFMARQKASTDASEAALAELEQAMEQAESKANAAHAMLNPQPPPVPEMTATATEPAAPDEPAPPHSSPPPEEPITTSDPVPAETGKPKKRKRSTEPSAPSEPPQGEPDVKE